METQIRKKKPSGISRKTGAISAREPSYCKSYASRLQERQQELELSKQSSMLQTQPTVVPSHETLNFSSNMFLTTEIPMPQRREDNILEYIRPSPPKAELRTPNSPMNSLRENNFPKSRHTEKDNALELKLSQQRAKYKILEHKYKELLLHFHKNAQEHLHNHQETSENKNTIADASPDLRLQVSGIIEEISHIKEQLHSFEGALQLLIKRL